MSALPPKADMCGATSNVFLDQKRTSVATATSICSFGRLHYAAHTSRKVDLHMQRAARCTGPVLALTMRSAAAMNANSCGRVKRLGFVPDAPHNKLYVDPFLPTWLPDLTVHDLRIGKHMLDIRFWCEG